MDGQPDRLALVRQGALDRLLDPPGRVSAELSALCRVEALHRFHQPDVALGNQVEQGQTEVRVIVRDLDHQAQVGADHEGARFAIALLDLGGQLDLLVGSKERDLPDLAQVNLYSSIAIFSSHITFHRKGKGDPPVFFQSLHQGEARRCFVLTFRQVVNNVKY